MEQIKISNMEDTRISGVKVFFENTSEFYEEGYFKWQQSELTAEFGSGAVSGGILKAWHHEPAFTEVEYHKDKEMFYFLSGNAIMLFIDISAGKPDMRTAQIVRIHPGTQIIIEEGKGHFVAVAEDDEPVTAVVVSPRMDAPRITLSDTLKGV